MERVVLVDEKDNEVGTEEKLEAHRADKLHRCFSLFVFNSKREFLLAKRAPGKYHSGGLWTNTCCSHPRPGEKLAEAIHRRLKEEVGFDTELREAFSFVYDLDVGNGMREHEFNHVFTGTFDGASSLNPEEISELKYAPPREILGDMQERPENYAAWFKVLFPRVISSLG